MLRRDDRAILTAIRSASPPPCRWKTPTPERRARAMSCAPKICWRPTRKRARGGPGPDRHLPFASGLRRVFLEDRSRELLPLVFVRRTIGEERKVRSRGQLPAEPRPNRRRERRIDMAKILIPTPLRQFTEKHDSVELDGATVGEVLTALTAKFPDLRKQIFNDEGKLRSFVNVYLNDEDIRYLKKEATPVVADRYAVDRAVDCRRARRVLPSRRRGRDDPFEGRNPALFAAPDHARSRHGRAVEAEERQGADGGRGRLGRAAGTVSFGRGRGAHRRGGFRRGRFHQSPAPGDSRDQGRGAQEAGFGRGQDARTSIRNIQIDRYEVALDSSNAMEIWRRTTW